MTAILTPRSYISSADASLISKLRSRRQSLNLTQSDVLEKMRADGIRISQTILSRVEKRERALSAGEAQSYARSVGTTLGEILREDPLEEWAADCRVALTELRSAQDAAREAIETIHRIANELTALRLAGNQLVESSSLSPAVLERLGSSVLGPLSRSSHLLGEEGEARLSAIARSINDLEQPS